MKVELERAVAIQGMQENHYYAQIWKFGPRPQKMNFSEIVDFYGKVSEFRF